MRAVGLLSPGDKGHTVAKVLQEKGMPVLTNLSDRSERTRALARSAGVEDVLSYEELLRRTDLILSILVPAEAQNAARNIARALESTGARTTFLDCNAVSPATVEDIAKENKRRRQSLRGGASITGPPPRREGTTRFYASGQHAEVFAEFEPFSLGSIYSFSVGISARRRASRWLMQPSPRASQRSQQSCVLLRMPWVSTIRWSMNCSTANQRATEIWCERYQPCPRLPTAGRERWRK